MNVGGDINSNIKLEPVQLEISVNRETLVVVGLIAMLATVYGFKKIKR